MPVKVSEVRDNPLVKRSAAAARAVVLSIDEERTPESCAPVKHIGLFL